MKVIPLDAGRFKLDGGAMFGIVPKKLWEKKNAPDEDNLCTWAARCLLIDSGDRKVLVDTGLGDKQDAKFRSHFHPHGDSNLMLALANAGYRPEDITDVLLTHLHFDHVGGATRFDEAGHIVCTFPNAVYWTHEDQWRWALEPNAKEAASFLRENLDPLMASGQLDMLPVGKTDFDWLPGIRLRALYGHTEAMLMPILTLADGSTTVYCADLIPSAAHMRLPWVLAYDIRPLITLEEKERLLKEAEAESWTLVFEHDAQVERFRFGG